MKDPYGKLLKQRGFTIVELLIVIVIIGILAALVIATYNGIVNRVHDSSIQNDLKGISKKAELYYVDYGYYPYTLAQIAALDIQVSKDSYRQAPDLTNNLVYCRTADGSGYGVLAASKSATRYYINNNQKTPVTTTQALPASGAVACSGIGVTASNWNWLYSTSAWTIYVNN